MREQSAFEDFKVGDRMRTPARTITETDLVVFAAMAGNPGGNIVHGIHTLAISVGLMVLAGNLIPHSIIALLGLERIRFVTPVKTGDTVHVDAKVIQTTAVDATKGLIALSNSIKNQRGEEILTYTFKILAGRRAAVGTGHG